MSANKNLLSDEAQAYSTRLARVVLKLSKTMQSISETEYKADSTEQQINLTRIKSIKEFFNYIESKEYDSDEQDSEMNEEFLIEI